MKKFKDKIAPLEINKAYYQDIKLGKNVDVQKMEIRNHIIEMIASQAELACSTSTSREAIRERVHYLANTTRNIDNGIFGLKAAFEWGISEVVWQIEQNTKEFKDMLKVLYEAEDPMALNMRTSAQKAFEKGQIADALDIYLELSKDYQNDFSVYLSLGIICFFYEGNKEKALDLFDKTIEIVKSLSDYYTSYALLYKALILRDLNRLEEAEKFSKQAMDLSPDFTEAIYQNAQYNALLKRPLAVVQLLKKIVHTDIIYCLKINKEKDFDGMRTQITKIFEEISAPQNDKIKSKQKEIDKKLQYCNETINTINNQGYHIPHNFHIEQLQEERNDLAYMVNYNSILNIFVIDYCFDQLDILVNQEISLLLSDCKKERILLGTQKHAVSEKLLKLKKKRNFTRFLVYLVFSQLYAIPIGLTMQISSEILIIKYAVQLGEYLGVSPGVLVLEVIAFISCFVATYVLTLKPLLKLKMLYSNFQRKEYKVDRIIKMIENQLRQ